MFEVPQKYSATRRIFNSLLSVWKCGQTQSFVFDILGKDIEVTSWLVSADDFSSRVARGANERVSAANEWVQRLLATSEEKSDKRTNHEVICLFYTYWDFKRILRKKIVMKNKFISNRVIKLNDGTIFFTSDKEPSVACDWSDDIFH